MGCGGGRWARGERRAGPPPGDGDGNVGVGEGGWAEGATPAPKGAAIGTEKLPVPPPGCPPVAPVGTELLGEGDGGGGGTERPRAVTPTRRHPKVPKALRHRRRSARCRPGMPTGGVGGGRGGRVEECGGGRSARCHPGMPTGGGVGEEEEGGGVCAALGATRRYPQLSATWRRTGGTGRGSGAVQQPPPPPQKGVYRHLRVTGRCPTARRHREEPPPLRTAGGAPAAPLPPRASVPSVPAPRTAPPHPPASPRPLPPVGAARGSHGGGVGPRSGTERRPHGAHRRPLPVPLPVRGRAAPAHTKARGSVRPRCAALPGVAPVPVDAVAAAAHRRRRSPKQRSPKQQPEQRRGAHGSAGGGRGATAGAAAVAAAGGGGGRGRPGTAQHGPARPDPPRPANFGPIRAAPPPGNFAECH